MGYLTFTTLIGPVGVRWSEDRLCALHLGGGLETPAGAPPEPISELVVRLGLHLSGTPQDFRETRVDLSVMTAFERRVLEQIRQIPAGQTWSYGRLAGAIGRPGAARAVGRALGRNPIPVVIPCHRVLGTSSPGGFSAPGGLSTKLRLLALEGVGPDGQPLPRSLWEPGELERAVDHLRNTELEPIVAAVGPCTLTQERPGEPFAALGEAIIYQQLAGKAAAAIAERVCTLFGGRFPTPIQVLETSSETFAGAGLSEAKRRALANLALAVHEGRLSLDLTVKLPDPEVTREITALKGLGPWTADMFLMFHLGRPDVFPVGDLGIRKALALFWRLDALPDAATMERRSRRWKPYRTVAAWYLWRSLGTVTLG